MGQRGRKSSAELSLLQGGQLDTAELAKPPKELTSEQAQVWQQVVNQLPPEWFREETYAQLIQYCRHVVCASRVNELIGEYEERKAEDFDIEEYDRLLKMQDREGRALSSLATRMRITQQSTYDKSKKKPKPGKRPWQSE